MTYEPENVERMFARLQVMETQLHSLFQLLYNPYNKPDDQLKASILAASTSLTNTMNSMSQELHTHTCDKMYDESKKDSTNE